MAKSDEELKYVEKQWDEFNSSFAPPEALNDDELKKLVIEDLTIASNMSVEEYTLYQKWLEVQFKYPTHEVSTLFGDEIQLQDSDQEKDIKRVKDNIWIPEHPDDYLNLEPRLILCNGKELASEWNTIRTFTHTMKNNKIGRAHV